MKPVIKPTIRLQVYEILKTRLINNYYKPGHRLSEQEICEELQVSRSPVREAFRQLESDGLIESNANKGVTVKAFSNEDIIHFYEIEMNIQIGTVGNRPKELSPEQITTFNELKNKFKEAYNKNDLNAYLSHCEKLHMEIVRLSGNPFAEDIYKRIGVLNHRFRLLSLKDSKRFKESYSEHIQIIDAILKNDIDKAKKVLKTHFNKAAQVLTFTTPSSIKEE